MQFGSIAGGQVPDAAGEHTDQRADPKGRSPSIANHAVSNQGRRKTRPDTNPSKDQTICDAALMAGNPARYELIRCRIDNRLACAEKEADRNKKEKRVCKACRQRRGERGENAPPEDRHRKHAPRAQLVREPPSRRLEECVANQERTENPAKVHITEAVLCRYRTAGNGDIHAI